MGSDLNEESGLAIRMVCSPYVSSTSIKAIIRSSPQFCYSFPDLRLDEITPDPPTLPSLRSLTERRGTNITLLPILLHYDW